MDVRGWLRAASDAARHLAGALAPIATPRARTRQPLQAIARLRLTDDVSRTLFAEYAEHRQSDRGHEENGWALLGLREGNDALALATLPAGTQRNAGEGHVRFNSSAQVVASRILRQYDRRLTP